MQEGRARLPQVELAGLIDRELPALPEPARACLDRAGPAVTGAACFVQLRPARDDPLFVARFLLDPTLPSVGVAGFAAGAGLGGAIQRYWAACLDRIVPAAELWEWVAGLPPGGAGTKQRSVLAADPDAPVVRALRRAGAAVFTPETPPLPLLASRFRHPVFILSNTAATARLIRLLRRFGGTAILTDSCLLAAYADDPAHVARLAEGELGRAVSRHEVGQWIAGIARPPALFLAEVAGAADTLIVHSAWLAAEISARYGCRTAVLPAACSDLPILAWGGPARVRVHASGLSADACIWAAAMLELWETRIQLEIVGDPAEHGAATVGLFLAMRGQSSLSAALAEWAGGGLRCVASRSVVEAIEPPVWVQLVPDQPSPLLLAEAILAALAEPAPSDAALADHRSQHDVGRLLEAL